MVAAVGYRLIRFVVVVLPEILKFICSAITVTGNKNHTITIRLDCHRRPSITYKETASHLAQSLFCDFVTGCLRLVAHG